MNRKSIPVERFLSPGGAFSCRFELGVSVSKGTTEYKCLLMWLDFTFQTAGCSHWPCPGMRLSPLATQTDEGPKQPKGRALRTIPCCAPKTADISRWLFRPTHGRRGSLPRGTPTVDTPSTMALPVRGDCFPLFTYAWRPQQVALHAEREAALRASLPENQWLNPTASSSSGRACAACGAGFSRGFFSSPPWPFCFSPHTLSFLSKEIKHLPPSTRGRACTQVQTSDKWLR